MSDTPKTDREARDGWSGDAECVRSDFARDLERKLREVESEVQCVLASLKGATTQLAERDAEIARLVEEKQILDWLEANPDGLRYCTWVNENRGRVFTFDHTRTIGECEQTLRDAVRAALSRTKPAEEKE